MTAREIAVRNAESKRQGKPLETARVCLCPRCEDRRRELERPREYRQLTAVEILGHYSQYGDPADHIG